MDLIEERLWLGNAEAAAKVVLGSERPYSKLGITHVLNCSDRLHYTPDESKHKVKVLQIKMRDGGGTTLDEETLGRFFKFIDEALAKRRNRVMVHCHVGINRSATIVIAWLMRNSGGFLSLDQTLEFVRKKRYVNPEPYMKALRWYEGVLKERRVDPAFDITYKWG